MTTVRSLPATEVDADLAAVTMPARAGADAVLDAVLRREADRWSAVPRASDLVEDLRAAVFAPGKRLRPAFAYWGHVGATGREAGTIGGRLGAALELLHTFALVHDDVMDGSELRRGEPSAHARAAAVHDQEGWRGEQRRFAEGSAILVGDLAYALANRLVTEMPAEVVKVWHWMCDELVVGQHLDLMGSATGDRDSAFAGVVSRLKSGHYSVMRPLQLGAALGGMLDRLGPLYACYGEPLGEAFQLRDDLLGVLGDPSLTGKPVGQDIRDGKCTVVLSLIADRAPAAARAVLDRAGTADLTQSDVTAIVELAHTTGAVVEMERRIERAVLDARSALGDPDLAPPARRALDVLATGLAWRDR